MEAEKRACDSRYNMDFSIKQQLEVEVSRRNKPSPLSKLESDVKRQEAALQKAQEEHKIEQTKLRADVKVALSKLEEQHKIDQEAAVRKLVERLNDRETGFINLVFKKIQDDYLKLGEQHKIGQDKLQEQVERQLRKLEEQHKMEHETMERVHEIQSSFNNLAMEKMDAQQVIREDCERQEAALRKLEEELQIKLKAVNDHQEMAREVLTRLVHDSTRQEAALDKIHSLNLVYKLEKLEAAVHKLQTPLPTKPDTMVQPPTKISLEAYRRIGLIKMASQFLRTLKR
ncbi:hypothetical protein SELMODRAFT_426491 [Selaginella moellendorffii]|uniref:Uncharacterized protein n=1 Tax=Selaginella moellendorffii TaxID=88036 RepID=D8SWJ1_SELML|nr:hypothetical protein SELMODRAFT_426491 [Selaginella moellendorffii]